MELPEIILKSVRVHNLKSVDLRLKSGQLIAFTGVSGSGKSSLAFDTLFVEGQRRYIESLSTFARRHLGDFPKPDADAIEGLSPTLAIEQKTGTRSQRSTVGTLTGAYDFLRVLFARLATPHCPVSGEAVRPQSQEQIVAQLLALPKGSRLLLLAPYVRMKKGEIKDDLDELVRRGYTRVRIDGKLRDLSEAIRLDTKAAHDVDLLIDRITVAPEERERLQESVARALEEGKGVLIAAQEDDHAERLFSTTAFAPRSGRSYGPLEPQDFSFNHPAGMCPLCEGIGRAVQYDAEKLIEPDRPLSGQRVLYLGKTPLSPSTLAAFAKEKGFSTKTRFQELPHEVQQEFLYGQEELELKRGPFPVLWKGVMLRAQEGIAFLTGEERVASQRYLVEGICRICHGGRLRPYPAAARLNGKTIREITALTLPEIAAFLKKLPLTETEKLIGGELIDEIALRLQFLNDVGLHYLTIDRPAPTLSGGEAQRVRLAAQLGSGLVGVTYVLDEPSIGLHPQDNRKLLETLRQLQSRGNTVIVVEHDEETILSSDHVVDMGPGAGSEGGRIIVSGSVDELLASPESLTGGYLSRRLEIAAPAAPRKPEKGFLTLRGAHLNNLKQLDVEIPVGLFTAVTGVSGSGKSSLITDTLYPALLAKLRGEPLKEFALKGLDGLDGLLQVIAIDQSPIGRTPRSNAATYVKLFEPIRDLFAELPESRAAGFQASHFSFNVLEGSCTTCAGMGMVKVDMDFLEDAYLPCPTCKGKRFESQILSVRYQGLSIADVLDLTVKDAHALFEAFPKIKRKLELLEKVGLSYLQIGQPSPTLSGGEAQRIKLARELSRLSTEGTLYILDEPTTGLHLHDLKKLIAVLQELVQRGATVIVIEHNMELVKCADWVVDLGPQAGEKGGELVGKGTPQAIAKLRTPTGEALKRTLLGEFPRAPAPEKQKEPLTHITVHGARQNNLKGITTAIPRGKITLCTGPSGAGKSSFALDTLYAEGQRRYTEALSPYARQFVKEMPKPKVEKIEGLSPSIAIEPKAHAGNPRSTVGTMTETYDYLRLLYAHLGTAYCPETGDEIRAISKEFVRDRLLELPEGTPITLLMPLKAPRNRDAFTKLKDDLLKQGYLRIRLNGAFHELEEEVDFDPRARNEVELVVDRMKAGKGIGKRLLEGIGRCGEQLLALCGDELRFFNLAFAVEKTGKSYPPLTPHSFSFNTASGMCPECTGLGVRYGLDLDESVDQDTLISLLCKGTLRRRELPEIHTPHPGVTWIGFSALFDTLIKHGPAIFREKLLPFMTEVTCPSCQGSRLNPLAHHVRLEGLSLGDLTALPIDEALRFLEGIKPKEKHIQEPHRQLLSRLSFLKEIGLDYLSLGRSAPTLSGGEAQRIRLARELGSGLTGCLYVLDEPTSGLHPNEIEQLKAALDKLAHLGNTLLIVEHDPQMVELADWVLEFGPGGGIHGGELMGAGKKPTGLTHDYLTGKKKLPLPKTRRKGKGELLIESASLHNLKGIDVALPLNSFTCFIGPSGSGKSTLVQDLLYPAARAALQARAKGPFTYQGTTFHHLDSFSRVVFLSQDPLGTTVRADVCTYSDLLTPLRQHFAEQPVARARGLMPFNFSYNSLRGMCRSCWGLGSKEVRLLYLPPVKVVCDVCKGYKLNPVSLQVTYRGKHLGDFLHMSVSEAAALLPPHPKITAIVELLQELGLGYLRLGQEVASLSTGEAQRLRLIAELAKKSRGKTLFLLDEPTLGLHPHDLARLIPLLQRLVERGDTLIVIEHNLDLIKQADYLIELGPGSGDRGGRLISAGPPD